MDIVEPWSATWVWSHVRRLGCQQWGAKPKGGQEELLWSTGAAEAGGYNEKSLQANESSTWY